MKRSYCIFRLFLGVADIIAGLIVLPTAVNTMLKTYQHALQFQIPINIIGQKRFLCTNEIYNYKNATLTINMLETITMAKKRLFPSIYKNCIGVFTNASFTASIYLLTFSGIDRLRALLKPLHYSQTTAKRFAISSSIVCWILAIFVSILPNFVNGLSYEISSSSVILLKGTMSVPLYLIMMLLPLVATWIILISTYLITRKTFDQGVNLSTNKDEIKNQRKINFNLFLMVGAFSLSLLPAVLVLIFELFTPGTDPRFPKTYSSTNSNISSSLKLTITIILGLNRLWNFLIYSLRIKTFRKAALEKYKKIWNLINCCK